MLSTCSPSHTCVPGNSNHAHQLPVEGALGSPLFSWYDFGLMPLHETELVKRKDAWYTPAATQVMELFARYAAGSSARVLQVRRRCILSYIDPSLIAHRPLLKQMDGGHWYPTLRAVSATENSARGPENFPFESWCFNGDPYISWSTIIPPKNWAV